MLEWCLVSRTNPKARSDRRDSARPALEIKVEQTIMKHRMFKAGEHVLVAVSGGADSTALLWCLSEAAPGLGLQLTAAHLNHSLRGEESDADERFVRTLSAEIGIGFVSRKLDIRKRAAVARKNLEEAAREARYDFLRQTADRLGATRVALGHNLNDQAETVLMRLIRGTGLEGLSGIHPVLDDLFIRPLLECSRADIIRYLRGAERKLPRGLE